jgi:hypothetical protein
METTKLNQLESLGFLVNPKKEYQRWGKGNVSEVTILNYDGFRVEIHSGEDEELSDCYYLYEGDTQLDEDGDFDRFIENVKEQLTHPMKQPSFHYVSIDELEYCVEIRYSKDKDISSIFVNNEIIWNTSYPSKDDRFHYLYCTDYIFPLWLSGTLGKQFEMDEDYRKEFNKSVKHLGLKLKGTKEEFYKNIK